MANRPKVHKPHNPFSPYDNEEQYLLAEAQTKVVSAIVASETPEVREQLTNLFQLMVDMQELLEEEFESSTEEIKETVGKSD